MSGCSCKGGKSHSCLRLADLAAPSRTAGYGIPGTVMPSDHTASPPRPTQPDVQTRPSTLASAARAISAVFYETPQRLLRALTGQRAVEVPENEIERLRASLEEIGLRREVQLEGLQYDGVHWMMKQEARAGWRGGILADEMGLGKTLQMLCVMALRCEPTLVVCPLSALKSWKDDINNFFQPKTFELIDYHQLRQEKRALPNPLPSNAVVLINPESAGRDVWSKTFSRTSEQKDLLCRELSQYCYVDPDWTWEQLEQKACEFQLNQGGPRDASGGGKTPPPRDRFENPQSELLKARFSRMVCDEAQFLKNLTSKSDSIYAKACMRIGDAVGIRWCITGTPAENKMMDYFSLLSFLRAEPFCQQPWFTAHVERYVGGKALSPSHDPDFNRCFQETMLRRGKERLQNMPEAHYCLVECPMEENELYEEEEVMKEEKGPELVRILRSSQAAGSMAKCRATLEVKFQGLTSEQLRAAARRPVADGGLGRDLRAPGEATQEWCLRNFCWERAWIEADKDEILRSSKWKAVRELLEKIWSRRSEVDQVEIECNVKESKSAGVWPWDSSKETRTLETDENTKVVLISRLSTRTFELLERMLSQMNRTWCRIDQSTPPGEHRDRLIDSFNTDPTVTAMLLGMKCGGTGINLQGAKVAVLVDCWWNAATEEQALNRIHRLSSRHPEIYFFKLYSSNNRAEQRCMEIQREKLDSLRPVLAT